MCNNKREGCYYMNGEICRDLDCQERKEALEELFSTDPQQLGSIDSKEVRTEK